MTQASSPSRSESDRLLAKTVSARIGRSISPWQIERWRQRGLIEAGQRRWRGRQGSEVVYSEAAVDQAVAVAELARPRRRLDEVALILFRRGHDLPLNTIKWAYGACLDRFEKWLDRAATEEGDADLNLAAAKAAQVIRHGSRSRQGRRMKARLRRAGLPDDALVSVWQNVIAYFQTGEPITDEGLQELLVAGGIQAAMTDQAAGLGPLAPDLPAELPVVLQRMKLNRVRERLAAATLEELVAARDDWLAFLDVAQSVATLARLAWNLPDAFGLGAIADAGLDELGSALQVPIMLILKPELSQPGAQSLMENVRKSAPFFTAAAALLSGLPRDVQRRMVAADPHALDTLPPDEQARIRAAAAMVKINGEDPAVSHPPGAGLNGHDGHSSADGESAET